MLYPADLMLMLLIISITLPASEDTREECIRPVLRVPADVFRVIVPHLQFKDRLNVSLISRDIYTAVHQMHTHIVVSTIYQLASFAVYISVDTSRASALRSLQIFIDYPLPSVNPSALEDAQRSAHLGLTSAINVELVCRGDATGDLVAASLTMSQRLSHLALQGLPPFLTCKEPIQGFFPLSLRSVHVTRSYPHIVHSLSLAWILRLVSHLPSLDTLTIEHHAFALFMLKDIKDRDPQRPGEESSKATPPLPVLHSVRTLRLLGCPQGVVHPNFVQTLAQSLPKLTTLHFNRTILPMRSTEYAVDHLVLTNLPYKVERNPVPWRARRLTYVLAGPNADSDRDAFSIAQCRVDLSPVLCLSISAPVIAPRIWDDLVANKWDARLLELESSVTSFAELVAPLVRVFFDLYVSLILIRFAGWPPARQLRRRSTAPKRRTALKQTCR